MLMIEHFHIHTVGTTIFISDLVIPVEVHDSGQYHTTNENADMPKKLFWK